MAATPYIAAIFSPLALVACADIWGFDNLTLGEGTNDAAAGPEAGSDVAMSGGGDSASIADVSVVNDSQVATEAQAIEDAASSDADASCLVVNANSCKGQCAAPCGCVPVYNLNGPNTSMCTNVGMSTQDNGCGTDTDCAPGYGCAPAPVSNCERWCLPTTACPASTTCQTGGRSVSINGETFYWCQ